METVLWQDDQAYLTIPPLAQSISDVETTPELLAIPTVYTWTSTVITVDEKIDYNKRALALWGIDTELILSQAAADFYLLYDLWLDGLDEGHFEPWLGVLVTQFSDYTDMVIGGELRHLPSRTRPNAKIPDELQVLYESGDFASKDRQRAWVTWHQFRQDQGIHAIEVAIQGFKCFSVGGFGGAKWGTIAKTLYALLTGTLPPIAFVDFCWGLQHNSTTFFNKVWSGYGSLMAVLGYNLVGRMDRVVEYASGPIRQLYTTQRGG